MDKIICHCGKELPYRGEDEIKCPNCLTPHTQLRQLAQIGDEGLLRLKNAQGFRRVGRFDDAQRELESILENEFAERLLEVTAELVLNYYEVTDYAFNTDGRVKMCKCYSADKRPVQENKDFFELMTHSDGDYRAQYRDLGALIEILRQRNVRIKERVPKYSAILLYDYSNEKDAEVAHALYNILSKKTDIFFPPVTLRNVPYYEREKYLMQVLHTPDKAPLMFLVFSDAFSLRKRTKDYYTNIARQCEDFADYHTKSEFISVTCDYEPPAMIRRLSIHTVYGNFVDGLEQIAEYMFEYIIELAFSDKEYNAYSRGEPVMKNENAGFSPVIIPIEN